MSDKVLRGLLVGAAVAATVLTTGAVANAAPTEQTMTIQTVCARINKDGSKVYTTAGSAFAFTELSNWTALTLPSSPIVNGRRQIKWNGGLGWTPVENVTVTNPDC